MLKQFLLGIHSLGKRLKKQNKQTIQLPLEYKALHNDYSHEKNGVHGFHSDTCTYYWLGKVSKLHRFDWSIHAAQSKCANTFLTGMPPCCLVN